MMNWLVDLSFIGAVGSIVCLSILLYRQVNSVDLRSPAFRQLYRRAIYEVIDACEATGVTYWFTEGTLIALLRYGCNHPSLIDNVVDDDIDLMIETKSHQEWLEISEKINQYLIRKGWTKTERRSTSKTKGTRQDKLQCWLIQASNLKTHVDIHNYLIDIDRGIAFSHGDASSYPFQYWQGYMPLDLIYPLRSCLCYDRVVPCPNQPLQILKYWHDHEYGDSCLALPLHPVSVSEISLIRSYSIKLHNLGHCSMYDEFVQCRTCASIAPASIDWSQQQC